MPASSLTYAAVTPARDEAENLYRLAESLVHQTVVPRRWIVVDDGSRDGTPEVVRELAAAHAWIQRISTPGDHATLPGAPVVRAFHEGLKALHEQTDVVVKLDADVSFAPDFFERLLRAFEEDPELGIASGACLELDERGEWRERHVTGAHVRGATRAYRRTCLEHVLPLEERMGWDGIDELKAAVGGWRTQIVPGLAFHHHRALGARDGAAHRRWVSQGEGAYFMGYRFSYLLFRTGFRMLKSPAAAGMVWGYAAAALRGEPRFADADVRAYLRRQQSVRNLLARMREATGHSQH